MNISEPVPSKQSRPPSLTNWEQCVLCQNQTSDVLQCPARSSKKPGAGYVTMAENLRKFQELGHVPLEIDLRRLDNGDGIEATLKAHSAKWHKGCQLKFNHQALARQDTLSTEPEAGPSGVHTRSSYSSTVVDEPICFLCKEPAGSRSRNLSIRQKCQKMCLVIRRY